jgi:glycosyltransferase involved in cell wall biosynthesis
MVGEGSLADRLARRAEAAGVRLVLPGVVQPADLPGVLAASDVFCLLTEYDCFAVVVAEAAAAGLPLVVSRHAGAADHLVVEGRNGWVVDPIDTAGVGARLRALLADPALRAAMGAASREIAIGCDLPLSVAGFVQAVTAARDERA